jgi:hypothetical protein
MTNKMQLCRIIYYSLAALHVPSDIFAHHQGHINCITACGITNVCRCRLVAGRKLLDDLKERRGYCHLKEEALDRTVWRARFGRGFGPVVRQTAKWMNEHDDDLKGETCGLHCANKEVCLGSKLSWAGPFASTEHQLVFEFLCCTGSHFES